MRGRIVWLDVIRIIACFLVIVNHTNSVIFLDRNPDVIWVVSISWFYFSKIAVPLFVMISGALLLKKESTYREIVYAEVRIVLLLIVFSFVYCIGYRGTGSAVIKESILNTVQDGVTHSFWYLYMYLGILIMLPLLQKLRKNMRVQDYLCLISISLLVSGVYPLIVHYFPTAGTLADIYLPLFSGYIGYLFVGDFIANRAFFEQRMWTIAGITIMGITIAISDFLTMREWNISYIRFNHFFNKKNIFNFRKQNAGHAFYVVI